MSVASWAGRLYRNTVIGNFLLTPVQMLWELRFRLLPEKMFLQLMFWRKLGYHLNLVQPKTLNEKIQWLKLNDRTSLHTQCADKYAVREFIADLIGPEYLVPLFHNTKDIEFLRPENIKFDEFVVKTTHDSGGVLIVGNKDAVNWTEIRRRFRSRLRLNLYHRTKEWQYKQIEPQIIIEKLLLDSDGEIPLDFKLHCFNGKHLFTQVDIDRFGSHKRNLYDANWELLDFRWIYENGPPVDMPPEYNKLTMLAESIAQQFDYVRVDFYVVDSRVYFGEITFHPEAGFGHFIPKEWDERLGRCLHISRI